MLDPYIRKNMTKVGNEGWYKCEIKVPDQHGVFQFKVDYNRPLYTLLSQSDKVYSIYNLDSHSSFQT